MRHTQKASVRMRPRYATSRSQTVFSCRVVSKLLFDRIPSCDTTFLLSQESSSGMQSRKRTNAVKYPASEDSRAHALPSPVIGLVNLRSAATQAERALLQNTYHQSMLLYRNYQADHAVFLVCLRLKFPGSHFLSCFSSVREILTPNLRSHTAHSFQKVAGIRRTKYSIAHSLVGFSI